MEPSISYSLSPPPILVTGMHNSGTSILAEILNRAGLFMSVTMPHHESHFFSIKVNNEMLLGGGDAWARLPLPSLDEVHNLRNSVGGRYLAEHWHTELEDQGYNGLSPWGIKDPRLCLLMPLYLDVFTGSTIVHIVRNPSDVAASLSGKWKAGVGKHRDYDHWRKLTIAYAERLRKTADGAASYIEIAYEDLCHQPTQTIEPLCRELGLRYDDDLEAFLAEHLYRHRVGVASPTMELKLRLRGLFTRRLKR